MPPNCLRQGRADGRNQTIKKRSDSCQAFRTRNELTAVLHRIPEHDFAVLGRTARAFASHPRVQRETEAIVNHVFALVSGKEWDVTSAARVLSRPAAKAIVANCREADGDVGTDVAWPLFLLRRGAFSLGYMTTDGSEFETGDRYASDVAAAGGAEAWLARLDANPRRWAHRLALAHREVEAMLPYVLEE